MGGYSRGRCAALAICSFSLRVEVTLESVHVQVTIATQSPDERGKTKRVKSRGSTLIFFLRLGTGHNYGFYSHVRIAPRCCPCLCGIRLSLVSGRCGLDTGAVQRRVLLPHGVLLPMTRYRLIILLIFGGREVGEYGGLQDWQEAQVLNLAAGKAKHFARDLKCYKAWHWFGRRLRPQTATRQGRQGKNGLTLKYASVEIKNNDRLARGPPFSLVCWRVVNGKTVQRRAVRHYQ